MSVQLTPAQRLALVGYHLQCDVGHDFGTAGTIPIYNINGASANRSVPGTPGTSEDACVNYFLTGQGAAWFGQDPQDFAARSANRVVFTVPEKTASFENWKAPVLFQGGNDKLGVIQDAGEFITLRLGARNVLTFGSILDPAGKPIAPEQSPIWYDPGDTNNTVDIPLAPYGFDPAKLLGLRIRDLKAGTVHASYILPNGTIVDAVGMAPPLTVPTPRRDKRINHTDPGSAGFFTSIKKVDRMQEELTLAGFSKAAIDAILKTPGVRDLFFWGKSLGDVVLVASGLSNVPGGAATNPYFNVAAAGGGQTGGAAGWKSWVSGESVSAPSLLILKTGDRLNWLRAILFNLGAIYEDQAKGGRKTKQYIYFPGTANPAAIIQAILGDFAKLRESVVDRYKTLVASLQSLLNATAGVNPAKTNFAPGGSTEITKQPGAILAAKLLNEVIAALYTQAPSGTICGRVEQWIGMRYQTAKQTIDAAAAEIESATAQNRAPNVNPLATMEGLRTYYQETLSRANACSPQSGSIYITKGKQDPYLTMKLIVANVPTGATDWPLSSSIDISLRNAFRALNGASDTTDETYRRLLASTDIQSRFFGKLGAPTADVPLDPGAIQATVSEVVGAVETRTDLADTQTGGGQVGGAYIRVNTSLADADLESELKPVLESLPIVSDFIDYVKGKGVQFKTALLQIYDVIRSRGTNRVVDPVLLEELMKEFRVLLVADPGTQPSLRLNNAQNIFDDRYILPKSARSSNATVLFNAYTYAVNARNAATSSTGQEVVTQSVRDFEVIEQAYLSTRVGLTTRSGTFYPQALAGPGPRSAAFGTNGGGLQTRRALYTNAETPEDIPRSGGRRGLYAGLRERAWPGTTARVRQHARHSRTRRQDQHVDRL